MNERGYNRQSLRHLNYWNWICLKNTFGLTVKSIQIILPKPSLIWALYLAVTVNYQRVWLKATSETIYKRAQVDSKINLKHFFKVLWIMTSVFSYKETSLARLSRCFQALSGDSRSSLEQPNELCLGATLQCRLGRKGLVVRRTIAAWQEIRRKLERVESLWPRTASSLSVDGSGPIWRPLERSGWRLE